jgi:hypothetical protein
MYSNEVEMRLLRHKGWLKGFELIPEDAEDW